MNETTFDLVRLSKSKDEVDICPNTMRGYNREGLPFYRRGKAVFFSKSELADFIRGRQFSHSPQIMARVR
jgi:hypothetical protein